MKETYQQTITRLRGMLDREATEKARLQAAVMWALGDEGSDFGDHIPTDGDGKVAPFWWRTELRKRAFSATEDCK